MTPSRLVCAALLLAGCSSPVAPDPTAYGAQYLIQSEPHPPILAGQMLTVTLQYGGCGGNHEFELRHQMVSATGADIWLRKVTPDQPCDMLVVERREFPVPSAVNAAELIRLLGPGDAEFPLRP
jgi:hypothetical protein